MVQKEILLKEINKNNGIISTKQVLKLGSQIWILFFYIFYFLIYYDYRRINEPFVITFMIYLFLQIVLLFFIYANY